MHHISWTSLWCLTQYLGSVTAFRGRGFILDHVRDTEAATAGYTYDGPTVPQYNISMPVDHFDSSNTQTYENRYWVNDTYYQPGGPIFFYDNGEEGVTDQSAAETLAEVGRTTSVMRLAEKYGGLAILWEHRYFGLSLPVPLENSSAIEPEGGFEGYRYLTLEQAFQDVVYFAQNFCPGNYTRDDCGTLRPSNAPWVWIGGSYPGIRGAVMRIRNPEIIYASWASSAPLEAMYDGSPYFNPIEAAMPSNCSTDVKAIVKYADEIMSGDHGEEAYEDLQRIADVTGYLETDTNLTGAYYNLTQADLYNTRDIAGCMVLAIFSAFQSFGPTTTLDLFCDYLESYNPNGTPANTSNPEIAILTNPDNGQITDQGLVATYNASVGLSAYFYALRRMFANLIQMEFEGTIEELPYDSQADQASWTYLIYTVIGWFQASNPPNITIVSQYYNLTADYQDRAIQTFSNITASDFGGLPDSELLNKYGGWHAQPSNVMFTVGQYDPWRGGSVLSEETQIGAPIRKATQKVPKCGTAPQGTDVYGVVLPGAAHAEDLYAKDSTGLSYDGTRSFYISLALFEKALDEWLPCFNASIS